MTVAGQRKRLSKAEGLTLVEQWRKSGESKHAFCRRVGVGTHVLRYWVEQEAQSLQSTSGDFVVVRAPHSSTKSSSSATASTKHEPHARQSSPKAVLVVLMDASSTLLARTVLELLGEVRS